MKTLEKPMVATSVPLRNEISVVAKGEGRALTVRGETYQLPKGIDIHKTHLEGELRGFEYALGLLYREITREGKDPRKAIEERITSANAGGLEGVKISRTELFEMASHCSMGNI